MMPSHYQTEPGFDPAEDHVGPFYFAKQGDKLSYAFEAAQPHCNAHGTVHGGILMTFADPAPVPRPGTNGLISRCHIIFVGSAFS